MRNQMTKSATATKAQIKRAITAAQEAGLKVAGIAPDGTILLNHDLVSCKQPSKWDEVEA